MARVLHFDCFSGASGDMTLAALLDLGVPEELIQSALVSLDLGGKLVVEKTRKAGFAATRIKVEAPPQDKHRHLKHIIEIVDRGKLTDGARSLAKRMFARLGEAEAASHGIPVEKVHFHEVGAVDSIYDFVGIAVGLDWLGVDHYSSRAVPTGRGFVDCEHGRLPVPAPAVARLLAGIPLASTTIESELTTPTGAAVIATLVREFTDSPAMTIEKIGVGAGTRELAEQPNILRLFLGETASTGSTRGSDLVWQLETNLDDATAEQIGYCRERLLEAGALDVYAIPIQMKKGRPGSLLAVLCDDAILAAAEEILFRETGTFGVRRHRVARSKLERKSLDVTTPWGAVRGKLGWNERIRVFSPEYEDCARLARERDVPLPDVYRAAVRAFEDGSPRQS